MGLEVATRLVELPEPDLDVTARLLGEGAGARQRPKQRPGGDEAEALLEKASSAHRASGNRSCGPERPAPPWDYARNSTNLRHDRAISATLVQCSMSEDRR